MIWLNAKAFQTLPGQPVADDDGIEVLPSLCDKQTTGGTNRYALKRGIDLKSTVGERALHIEVITKSLNLFFAGFIYKSDRYAVFALT